MVEVNDQRSPNPSRDLYKLLRKLALTGKAIARPGKRGEQSHRVYQIEGQNNPIRQKLLAAARTKLDESVSTTRIRNEQTPLPIMDANSNPPLIKKWGRHGALDKVQVGEAQRDTESLEYLQSITPA